MEAAASDNSAESSAAALQARLVGAWAGRARLWFRPDELAEDEHVEGEVVAVAGGRWLRHTYATTIDAKPVQGSALLGYGLDPPVWQAAWVDGFHTSASGVMLSEGPLASTDTVISVLGSYGVGDGPPWGWRTEYEPGSGSLTVRHFNVSPEGEQSLAVQFDYRAVAVTG